MTIGVFAETVAAIGRQFKGSVTSWGRTTFRAVLAGGFAGDPHTWWLGADMVYDTGSNRPGSTSHPRTPHSCPLCSGALKVIHETSHDHYQPADFPAGPVKEYTP